MIGALRAESDTARHLSVGPDLALKRLNLENLVLEQHFVLLNSLSDAHILAVEGRNGALLAPLELGLGLGGVVGIVTVQVAVIFVVLAGLDSLLDFIALFLLLLGKLEVKPLLFGLLFELGGEGPP